MTFGLSSTTLADFDFKIFYDKNLTNEYLSSQDSSSFNVGTAGTIGIGTNNTDPIGAALTVQYSASTPVTLYYGLTKGGYISTADTEVPNYSEIYPAEDLIWDNNNQALDYREDILNLHYLKF